MALALKNHHTLTIVIYIWIAILIFCFAGCATGSCLSYGHSCWGAHGKRSDVQDTRILRILAANSPSGGFSQTGIESSPKAQWILSHLITGQPILPLTDKYHVRWNSFPKNKAYVLSKLERNTAPTDDGNTELIRVPIKHESKDNERESSNLHGKKFENTPEILLLSSDEYDEPINDLEKVDMLKFLSKKNGNLKLTE